MSRPRPSPLGCAFVAFCFAAGGLSIVGAATVAHWLIDRLAPELAPELVSAGTAGANRG